MKKIFLIIAFIAVSAGFIGRSVCRIYYDPDKYTDATVYYNGTLLEYKNLVARKNDDTGLRLEYIGTVDSVAPDTELPDTDFECSSKAFLNAKLYTDDYGRYYLCRSNGDLIMLENTVKNNYSSRTAERGLTIAR